MKKLFYIILFLSIATSAFAQKELLQLDEGNRYVYYQVVDKPGLPADTLYQRALSFAKVHIPKAKLDKSVANTVVTKEKFLVYSGSSVVKKEAGEVAYNLFIETKDQKYRYKISSFVFTPYKRDRFGNMTAVPGVEVPFEKLTDIYAQKEADSYLTQAGAFCKATGENLKAQMDKIFSYKKTEPVKKVNTDKW